MRTALFWGLICGVMLVAVSSRSNVATPEPAPAPLPPTPIDEPITGEPIVPAPGSAITPKDPFAPYDIGPASAAWSYEDLPAAEKVIVDKGRNVEGWDQINDAFANASAEQAQRAAASAASAQLGVANLAEIGVIP